MNKYGFVLLVSLFTVLTSIAQQGAELVKTARKEYTLFSIDPETNPSKLEKARTTIEEALKTTEGKTMASAWVTKGTIYQTRQEREWTKKQLNPSSPLSDDNDALTAFTAFEKALGLTPTKYEKDDALKGISAVQNGLINIGNIKYEATDYEKAFFFFRAAYESHVLLSNHAQKSILDDPEFFSSHLYITALSATMANRCADAIIFYNKLYIANTDQPEVYEGLYNCKLQLGDAAGANAILTQGRQKFPDNNALLFKEINALLKAGQLTTLPGLLEAAIKLEPKNAGLYTTLGSVYNELYQQALKENKAAVAATHLDKAKKSFTGALTIDPVNLDANYALGSLYYNKAAVLSTEISALADDESAAAGQKIAKLKNDINSLFDEALPYFKKAESGHPNDMNTIFALYNIFSVKEDANLMNAMKKRLDTLKAGGQNASSYFK
jgi:tetratricopeptide (TPR) repeat protein